MCRLVLLSLALLANTAMSSPFSLWENVYSPASYQANRSSINLPLLPDTYRLLRLDEEQMRHQLSHIRVDANSNHKSGTGLKSRFSKPIKSLEIPLPNGESITIKVKESSMMAAELTVRHPSIRTYTVDSDINNGIYGAIDMTTQGFHAMLFMPDGRRLFIDPRQAIDSINTNTDPEKRKKTESKNKHPPFYISYYNKHYHPEQKEPFQCHVEAPHHALLPNPISYTGSNKFKNVSKRTGEKIDASSINVTTYRLAMAATAEYAAFHGGIAGALSAIATTVNRVNVIYKRDLAVQFELITNNDLLIQNSTTIYSNNSGSAMLGENQALIDNIIGSENYDIGHVVSTGGGGVAFFGTVCNDNYKAQGVTGSSNPIGDAFDIDYVAHEIGHQLAAQHTFNKCGSYSRSTFLAYEPGSGSTIMGYAGICASNNIQQHSDAMFHAKSIVEMRTFITRSQSGASCGTRVLLDNQPPNVNAGSDFIIPANTPFELTGSANDPENDRLSFSWEQVDKGDTSDIYTDTSNNPLFRVFLPQTVSTRIFPNITSIINNTISMGETLPTTTRSLNFLLAVRDGKGNMSSDQTTLTVVAGNTFAITSHNAFQTLSTGEVTEVTWEVANTDTAPINCSDVNILLSTNNGGSFVNVSDGTTPNDGSVLVTIPVDASSTTQARFKVKCEGNIFFNISTSDLKIEVSSHHDSDSDGTPDISDAFPFDFDEDTDTDNDGIGNNSDRDDDGDGTLDTEDAFPLDSSRDTEDYNSNTESIIVGEEPATENTGESNPTPSANAVKILPIIINLLLSD